MNSDIQNWKKLLEAISLERDEEINFHRNEIKELSPQEREKRGRAILDLKANHGGFVLGERTLTDFIKKNNTKQDSKNCPDKTHKPGQVGKELEKIGFV